WRRALADLAAWAAATDLGAVPPPTAHDGPTDDADAGRRVLADIRHLAEDHQELAAYLWITQQPGNPWEGTPTGAPAGLAPVLGQTVGEINDEVRRALTASPVLADPGTPAARFLRVALGGSVAFREAEGLELASR